MLYFVRLQIDLFPTSEWIHYSVDEWMIYCKYTVKRKNPKLGLLQFIFQFIICANKQTGSAGSTHNMGDPAINDHRSN